MATKEPPIQENSPPTSLPTWAAGGEMKTITVDGINMRYLGIGQGEPLVLVHTIRSQLDYFQKLIPTLAKHYRVYVIDLPSHGHTEISNKPLDKPMLVSAVTNFIKTLKLNNVTLMGESIGGSISLGIAAEKNVKAKQVFALNPAEYDNSNGLDRSSILGKILFTGIKIPMIGFIIANAENSIILKMVFQGGFNNTKQLPNDFIKIISKQGRRKGYPKAFRSIFLNWKGWIEGAARYSQIDTPVTFIYSDNDWSWPAERVANQKRIRDSKLMIIDDCGHFSSLEKPQEVLNIILANKHD